MTMATKARTKSKVKSKGRKRTSRHGGYWSASVTHGSNALDLERGAFTWKDPKRIALSLKRSAERSKRRKADPFRSAMSMLTFYINRGGRGISKERKQVLAQAKVELRRVFGRV